jgi:hypothetical protein
MAGTGIHSLAMFRAQILRFATTGINPWETALKCTADCQALRSGSKEYMRLGPASVNPFSSLDYCLWQYDYAVWLFYLGPSSV